MRRATLGGTSFPSVTAVGGSFLPQRRDDRGTGEPLLGWSRVGAGPSRRSRGALSRSRQTVGSDRGSMFRSLHPAQLGAHAPRSWAAVRPCIGQRTLAKRVRRRAAGRVRDDVSSRLSAAAQLTVTSSFGANDEEICNQRTG